MRGAGWAQRRAQRGQFGGSAAGGSAQRDGAAQQLGATWQLSAAGNRVEHVGSAQHQRLSPSTHSPSTHSPSTRG